jgi:hypothetical protein
MPLIFWFVVKSSLRKAWASSTYSEVDAHLLELHRRVLLAGADDAVEALRHGLDLLLKLRAAHAVALADVARASEVVEDLVADRRDGLLVHADALERAVRDDDGVGRVQRRRGHERLAPLGREVLVVRHHDVGERVELHELVGELLEHVVGHHVDRLLDEAQALLLHAPGDHLDRLAGADRVREVGVAGLDLAPDGAQLVRVQLEAQADARQRQVRAVERRGAMLLNRLLYWSTSVAARSLSVQTHDLNLSLIFFIAIARRWSPPCR